jgi:NAD(P)-dependent dehydrogenase (short-subunit alcohol dehydrogenase family)
MNRLNETVAVIADGVSEANSGFVDAFLQEGATVIALSESHHDEVPAISKRDYADPSATDRLTLLDGDLSQVNEVERMRDEILDRFGQVDAVVASLNGRRQNQPLVEVAPESWRDALDSVLTTHFVLARTFLPVLAAQPDGGSYLFVNDPACEMPDPHAGSSSVTAAGQRALMETVAQEYYGNSTVRINELDLPISVSQPASAGFESEEITIENIGQVAAALSSRASEAHNEIIRLRNRSDIEAWMQSAHEPERTKQYVAET